MTQQTQQASAAQLSPDSRAGIVDALWASPGLSRVELAESLNMDKSTMSRSVAKLLELGMIRETEEKDSGPQGGRRRTGLEVSGAWGLWLGLEMQPDSCRGLLVDLAGEIRGDFAFPFGVERDSLGDALEHAFSRTEKVLDKTGMPLRGGTLAVPGVVMPETGILQRSRPLGVDTPLDLGTTASDIFEVRMGVENDVNSACRAEMRFVPQAPGLNFLYLLAEARDQGLSLGIGTVISHTLHRGDHGAAGEISSVFRRDGRGQLALDHRQVARAPRDTAILKDVARELAPQVAMMANAMDIDRLILGGLFKGEFEEVAPVFEDAYSRLRTYPDLASPRVSPSQRNDEAVAYGAAIEFTAYLRTQEFWRTI